LVVHEGAEKILAVSIIICIVLLGSLLDVLTSGSAVAPLIYAWL
jgi:hypothetical protein